MKLSIYLSCFLILLGGGLYFAHDANVAVFRMTNQSWLPAWFWLSFTTFGDKLFVGCFLFLCLRNKRELLTNALLAGLAVYIVSNGAKALLGVLRPEYALDHVVRLGASIPAHNYAMPSGHTMTAFMALVFVVYHYSLPKWAMVLGVLLASLVGVSRVAVGAHWPSDCLVGAGLGVLVALPFASQSVALHFKGVKLVTYFFYAIFIFLSAKHLLHSLHSIEHLLMGVIGLFAMSVWIVQVVPLIKTKQWI